MHLCAKTLKPERIEWRIEMKTIKTKKEPIDRDSVLEEIKGSLGYMPTLPKLCTIDLLKIKNLIKRNKDLEKITNNL